MSVLREEYVCLQQYRGNTQRLVQKLRINQWPLELFNGTERLDACAENKSYTRMYVGVP